MVLGAVQRAGSREASPTAATAPIPVATAPLASTMRKSSMFANKRYLRLLLLLTFMTQVYSTESLAGFGGQSSKDGPSGTWQEVHCETGSGWQKCQPPPCEAQGVSWGSCASSVPRTLLNGSVKVGNIVAGYTGSATYQCVDYQLYSQWTYISGSCVANPPPPPPDTGPVTRPPPGSTDTFIASTLICGPSNPYYASPSSVSNANKDAVIAAYRSHPNNAGRCPEHNVAGWDGWADWMGKIPVNGINSALTQIRSATIPPSTQTLIADSACAQAARSYYKYGYATATYIKGTGNSCLVTF